MKGLELVELAPLPEELDRGYLGHLMRVNGLPQERDLIASMAHHFGLGHKPRRELPCIELLSMMAGQSMEQFVLNHSNVPLQRAITPYPSEVAHGSTERRATLVNHALVPLRKGAYFCVDCVHADQAFHGLSYWRRNFQVPGQLWCPKHLIPLRYVEHASAYEASPAYFIESARVASQAVVRPAQRNASVLRFLDVAAGLMQHPHPVDARKWMLLLRRRALRLGLQCAPGKPERPLISDLMRDSFPRQWLASVLPVLVDKRSGEVLEKVDGVLWGKSPSLAVWPYLLAVAVLFDSADEALNEIFAPESNGSPQQEGSVRGAALPTGGKNLLTAYIACNGNHAAVAASLVLPAQRVNPALSEMGLPDLRTEHPADLRAALAAFYIDGMSLGESAAKGGLSHAEMEALLRSSGAPLASALVSMPNSNLSRKGVLGGRESILRG